MKEVINLYKKHQSTADNYCLTLLKTLPDDFIENADTILRGRQYIQLIYAVDEDFKQISPTVCRKERDMKSKGSDKSRYFSKLALNNEGYYISNPYIHYRTGKASISVVKKVNNVYQVYDFDLIMLLEELNLIEYNSTHEKFKKIVYLLGSTVLAVVSIVLILYGGYLFIMIFIAEDKEFLHDTFKSIIAVTLGIAIFDLAKQIFEHEVIFHSFTHEDDRQYKVLGKFLISIIIALSIETLMVVFKIALDDYTHMISAFYLLIGTTIMFIGLAYFYKTISQNSIKRD